jgi:hypothetical protein
MEVRYNVYFAGQVAAGQDVTTVRSKLAKVFNADENTLDKLFSGKNQLVKRDCDQATALKYKDAMERAGAIPIIKTTEAAPDTQAKPARATTAAEKIAALAAAPDEDRFRKQDAGAPANIHTTGNNEDVDADANGIGLAPTGTPVLREDERAALVVREVDTTGLALDTTANRLSEEPPPPPPAPDTRHLSMGAAGEAIPNLPSAAAPVSPNLDGLVLAAPGTDFSDCAPPEPPPLPLDLSSLVVEPPGAALLDEQYRRRDRAVAPSTEHLSLED